MATTDEEKKPMTPGKAIRAKCLDCMCGSAKEVRLCPEGKCALFPFRFGKNPHRKREYTDDEKAAMRERLWKARTHNPFK